MLDKRIYVNEIVSLIKMDDIFNKYGFEKNRMGFIRCPFHKEKTASLKAYKDNKKFKCFGCGSNGSVIDFVMQLYDLNFYQAIERINYDFHLDMPIGKKISLREKRNFSNKYKEIKAKQEEEKKEKEAKENLYWSLWSEYIVWDYLKNKYRPKNEEEDISPIYAEAIHQLSYIEYKIDALL